MNTTTSQQINRVYKLISTGHLALYWVTFHNQFDKRRLSIAPLTIDHRNRAAAGHWGSALVSLAIRHCRVAFSVSVRLPGDIVAILDINKSIVVSYVYDAWGRPISKTGNMAGTLGTVQPFRYRGYVYDEETGLYYLRSRYSNPICCRFINADIIYKGNTFTYCNNSPSVYVDENGYDPIACYFDDMGIGNIMATQTSGLGCFASGWNTYTYAGVMQSAADDEGRAKQVDEALDIISVYVGIPFIAFASTAIATSVSIGFAFAAEAFAKQALALNLGKDIAYGIKAVTILCGTVIGSDAQGAFNETFFKQEVEPLDYGKESISAIVSAISPIDLPWKLEYIVNAIKAIFENDLIPAK